MDAVTQGTLVAERYRLIREIGLGGMGSVWLAYDEALASRCALKLLLPEPERNEEFAIRLECEAKCAAQLRSPHVVDVLNRGHWQGQPFIVMEYMEGEDLSVRLERVGRLDATTTYRIVAQVARALTRAHALGIIHRDVKPANIFLIPSEEHEVAKVLDFGIAKHRALPNAFENPLETTFIGTPCYMSPEQAHGKAVDYRCDLWALAVITFECLTGSLPFQDESVMTVIRAIRSGDLPALTANHPELPEALEAWWRRATATDIDARFQSAKEFADALGDALEAFPRMPISRPERGGVRDASVTLLAHSLRTQAKPSRGASVRMPSRARRGLSIAGAAACAALGFGASALRVELHGVELKRQLQAFWGGSSEAAPEKPASEPSLLVSAAQAAPVVLMAPAAASQAGPEVVPVAVNGARARLRGPSAARSLTPSRERGVRGDAAEDSAAPAWSPPSTSQAESQAESQVERAPSNDELPLRRMPPGEKDYGI